jgi:hypothetical protein
MKALGRVAKRISEFEYTLWQKEGRTVWNHQDYLRIILPPLGVFLQVGIGKHFWINILLTLLAIFPVSFTPYGFGKEQMSAR